MFFSLICSVEVNIDEVPHISMAYQLRNSSCSSEDYTPTSITTNYKPFVSTNDDGDKSYDSEMKNALHGSKKSSKRLQPSEIKRRCSFPGKDSSPLPPSTATLPKLPKKRTTYIPEIGQNVYISMPTSTRANKPLPLLPFEWVDSGDKHQSHKNKNRKSNTEDNVNAEGSMLDEDSDSSDPYENIKFGYSDEQSEEAPPLSPLSNGVNTALNKSAMTNSASNHDDLISPTVCTSKQEDLTVVPFDSTALLAHPEVAEDRDKNSTTEENVNGELLLKSEEIKCSPSSDGYVIETIKFLDGNIKEPLTSAVPLTNPSIVKDSTNSQLPAKSDKSICLEIIADDKDGSMNHSSSCPSNTAPLATVSSVPVENKMNKKLTINNDTQNSDHIAIDNDNTASQPIYDDTVVKNFQTRNSNKDKNLSQSKLYVNSNVTVQPIYCNVPSTQSFDHIAINNDTTTSQPDTVVQNFQIRNSSKVKCDESLSQSKLYVNNSVTVQPIYCNLPANKKPLSSQTSSYVKMYKVMPLVSDGNDQLLDEVYAYDYIYHRNLMLRKSGKDCSGIPPRNISRSSYTPSSADYVNINTEQDYVNFKVVKSHLMVHPPRTKDGAAQKDKVKPVPRPRANYRPVYPARDIPRLGYFLSGPLAKP